MRRNQPTDRASTEIQYLVAALVTVVAYGAFKRLMYGFSTDPAASTAQVTNVANGIGNAVSAAPRVFIAVLVVGALVARR